MVVCKQQKLMAAVSEWHVQGIQDNSLKLALTITGYDSY